eukprot:7402858-Pyramimonas_sp.AAC.1
MCSTLSVNVDVSSAVKADDKARKSRRACNMISSMCSVWSSDSLRKPVKAFAKRVTSSLPLSPFRTRGLMTWFANTFVKNVALSA